MGRSQTHYGAYGQEPETSWGTWAGARHIMGHMGRSQTHYGAYGQEPETSWDTWAGARHIMGHMGRSKTHYGAHGQEPDTFPAEDKRDRIDTHTILSTSENYPVFYNFI